MITIDDYRNLAAQCQAVERPNENAYLILAAATYMIDRAADAVRERPDNDIKAMLSEIIDRQQSHDAPPADVIRYHSDTEFGQAVTGKNTDDVIQLFDELMTAVSVHKRNLYYAALDRMALIK